MRNTFSDRSQGMTRDETSILFGSQSKLFMNTKLRLVLTQKKSAALMCHHVIWFEPFIKQKKYYKITIYMAKGLLL